MLPAELTEALRPPNSVMRLGVFLQEILECPYIFQGSSPVQISLTLTEAEDLAGYVAAKYLSPILLGTAWAEVVSLNRLQNQSVRDFVFWVGRLQQAAYQEIYQSSVYGQTALKGSLVMTGEAQGASSALQGQKGAQSVGSSDSQDQVRSDPLRRRTVELGRANSLSSPTHGEARQPYFMAPSLERAAAFGLGAAAATVVQNSMTPPAAAQMAMVRPIPGLGAGPESATISPYFGAPGAFVESGGRIPNRPVSLLPQGSAPLRREDAAVGFQAQGPGLGSNLTPPSLPWSVPASVIGPLTQMDPSGLNWLLDQSPVRPPEPVPNLSVPTLASGAGSGQPPVAPEAGPSRIGFVPSAERQPSLFIPALVGAALWLASRRGGPRTRPHQGGPSTSQDGSEFGGEPEPNGEPGYAWRGAEGGLRGGPRSRRRRQGEPATARMGFATLFSAEPTFAPQNEGETGSAIEMPLESLAPQGQPLTESGMQALVAALPPGASFLYPSLSPGSLGKGAVNVPLAAELAERLIQASSPGVHSSSTAERAARLAKAEAPGGGRSAPLAARLIPTVRPSKPMSAGAAEGEGLDALGSGMGQRPRSLSFLGAPVRLAPSLSGRSELQDEVRAKTGSQLSSQPKPSKPSTFNNLRTQVLGGMPSVDIEPDQQAWAKARPSMGLASSSPLEVLSGDAWNPALADVKTGRRDSSAPIELPSVKMGDGSVRPIGQTASRPIMSLQVPSASKGATPSIGALGGQPSSPTAPTTSLFGSEQGGARFGAESHDFQPLYETRAAKATESPVSLPSPTILKLEKGQAASQGFSEQKASHFGPSRLRPDAEGKAGMGFLPSLASTPFPLQAGRPMPPEGLPARQTAPSPSPGSAMPLAPSGVNRVAEERPFPSLVETSPGLVQTPTMNLQLPKSAAAHEGGQQTSPGTLNLSLPMKTAPPSEKPALPDVGSARSQPPATSISAASEPFGHPASASGRETSAPLPGPAPLPLPKKSSSKLSSQTSQLSGQFSLSGGTAAISSKGSSQERSIETKGSSTTGIDSHEVNAMAMEVYSILRRRLSFEAQRMGR